MEVLIIVIIFGSLGFIAYTFLSTRHKERMAIIERAEDPELVRALNRPKFPKFLGKGTLKFGLLFLFAGVGLFFSYFISETLDIPEELAVFSMLLMGAGSGLLTYYFIVSKDKDNPDIVA